MQKYLTSLLQSAIESMKENWYDSISGIEKEEYEQYLTKIFNVNLMVNVQSFFDDGSTEDDHEVAVYTLLLITVFKQVLENMSSNYINFAQYEQLISIDNINKCINIDSVKFKNVKDYYCQILDTDFDIIVGGLVENDYDFNTQLDISLH